jgi:hypothetical protein
VQVDAVGDRDTRIHLALSKRCRSLTLPRDPAPARMRDTVQRPGPRTRGGSMSNPSGYEDVVDLIYQAAIDPELWPSILDRLVELIDGEAATLHWYDLFSGASNGVGVRVDQAALDRGFEDFGPCCPLTEKDPAKKRHRLRNYVPKIRRDIDWLP